MIQTNEESGATGIKIERVAQSFLWDRNGSDTVNKFFYNHPETLDVLEAARIEYLRIYGAQSGPLRAAIKQDKFTGEWYVELELRIKSMPPEIFIEKFAPWWDEHSSGTKGLIELVPTFIKSDGINEDEYITYRFFDDRELERKFSFPRYTNGCVSKGHDAVMSWLDRHFYVVPILYTLREEIPKFFASVIGIELSVHVDPEDPTCPSQLVAEIMMKSGVPVADAMNYCEKLFNFMFDHHMRDQYLLVSHTWVAPEPTIKTYYRIVTEVRPLDSLELYKLEKFEVEGRWTKPNTDKCESVWVIPDQSKVEDWVLSTLFPTKLEIELLLQSWGNINPSETKSYEDVTSDHCDAGLEWFEANKDWLVKNHHGKWICIHAGVLVGIFETVSDASSTGYQVSGSELIYVHEILPEPRVIHMPNLGLFY